MKKIIKYFEMKIVFVAIFLMIILTNLSIAQIEQNTDKFNYLLTDPWMEELSGPTKVRENLPYTWTVRAGSWENDFLQYHIDWGDNDEYTTTRHPQRQDVRISHTYYNEGYHTLSVYAIGCTTGKQSGIKTLSINCPKIKATNFTFSFIDDNYPMILSILKSIRENNI